MSGGARQQQGADGVEALAGGDADRVHVDRERHRGDLVGHPVGVRHQVRLGEDDHRLGARAPGQREQPLDATQLRVGVEVLDDEHDVDVRGERLHARRLAGRVADQGRAAGAERAGVRAAVGLVDEQPVAHRRGQPLAVLRGDEAVAVERDAPGLPRVEPVRGQHEDRALVGAHHADMLKIDHAPTLGRLLRASQADLGRRT